MNVYTHVQATTASDLTAEQWREAWMLAAPVVVAANRFVEAEKDGTRALIEDAHFQLLRALAEYKAGAANSQPEEPHNERGDAMRLLVAKYPDGSVRLWDPEMQETLENLPVSERPELLGIVSPSYAEISEPEPV